MRPARPALENVTQAPGTGLPPAGSPASRLAWLAVLTALAISANAFAPVIFAAHSLVLGVVFYWIALRFTGPLPALIVLAGAAATLTVKWGQPFSPLLMALEGIAVGFAWRRGRNPILADLTFWALVGTPASWFLYRDVFPIPDPSYQQALWLQPINGLFAVWLAFLVLEQIPAKGGAPLAGRNRNFRSLLLRRYVAFGTVPVVAATVVVVRNFEVRAINEARENLRIAALNLAGAIERQASEARGAVAEVAARQQKIGWREDAASLERALDTLHARSGLFVTLLAADAEGRVIAAAPSGPRRERSPDLPNRPVSDREYFREPMMSGQSHVSGVFRGRGFGQDMLIAVSAPVLDAEGRTAGVIEGSLLIGTLEEILLREVDGKSRRALLSDQRLQVIAGHGFDEAPLQNLKGTSLGNAITRSGSSPSRVTSHRGGKRVSFLSTHVRLPGLGWTLTLQREWGDVLRPVVDAYVWSLLIAVTTVLVASVFTTWSLRDFLRAWRDLIAFSRAPAVQSDLLKDSARLDLPQEFSELIRNFTLMADRLESERRGREDLLARLETRVQERTAELETALGLARTAERTKGVFLATVSHELRTPLTAIVTGVKLLRMTPTARAESETRTLSTLENSSRALMSVISDVLDYSRLEAGAIRIEATIFQPSTVLTAVASILEPEVQRSGLALRLQMAHSAELTWKGDVQRMKQVLLNLAGNAVKFTSAGSVEIASWTTDKPRRLWCAVTDTGPGIPPGQLESVFEAFVQLEGNRVQSQGGTGLGLSISRRLVELMGGEIRAVDTCGRGARFEFWLPEQPPESGVAPSLGACSESPGTRET